MILLNHPCMNHDDFLAYKKRLDDISADNGVKNEHSFCQEKEVTFPALIVSGVFYVPGDSKSRCITHMAITKQRLLKVLGLSTEDIKIEFDMKGIFTLPEEVEDREV